MKNKFKVGEKVFYFSSIPDDDEPPISVNVVISQKEAALYYTGYHYDNEGRRRGTCSIDTIKETSRKQYNCRPVFIRAEGEPERYCGWMPENQLYPYTKAVKLLYENKSK